MTESRTLVWLRSTGKAGSLLAGALQFVAAYQGVAVSAVITALIAASSKAFEWVQTPYAHTVAGVFLVVLWSYIGVFTLKSRRKTQVVRIEHDYAYALILDGGWMPVFGKFASDHPSNANADALSIQCNFRNVSAGPVRVRVEEFRVVLDGRTCDDPFKDAELVLARLAPKGFKCGAIAWDRSKSNLQGTAVIRLLYGPPDSKPVRRYVLKLKIQVAIDTSRDIAQVQDDITSETDEPVS